MGDSDDDNNTAEGRAGIRVMERKKNLYAYLW